jgi:hypothetical protein
MGKEFSMVILSPQAAMKYGTVYNPGSSSGLATQTKLRPLIAPMPAGTMPFDNSPYLDDAGIQVLPDVFAPVSSPYWDQQSSQNQQVVGYSSYGYSPPLFMNTDYDLLTQDYGLFGLKALRGLNSDTSFIGPLEPITMGPPAPGQVVTGGSPSSSSTALATGNLVQKTVSDIATLLGKKKAATSTKPSTIPWTPIVIGGVLVLGLAFFALRR